MNLTNTKLSKSELLDVVDCLHDAIQALNKAYTIASQRDSRVGSQLWNEVVAPSVDLILGVTGGLIVASRPNSKDAEAIA